MNINWVEVILALIGFLSTIVTVVLVPYIKKKTTVEQQKELATWVKIAVSAAEQIFSETLQGKQRKEWVLEWLANQGIDIDDEQISNELNALIEAFVAQLNNPDIRLAV